MTACYLEAKQSRSWFLKRYPWCQSLAPSHILTEKSLFAEGLYREGTLSPSVLIKKPRVICCKHIEQDTQQVTACNDGSEGGRWAHCWGLSLCACVRWGCNCIVCERECVLVCVHVLLHGYVHLSMSLICYVCMGCTFVVCVHTLASVSAWACSCRFIGMLRGLQRCGT